MRLIAIAATATILAGSAQAQEWAWFSFSRSDPAIKILNHDVRVEVDSASRDGHPVWVAKRVEQSRKQPNRTTWTDSYDCPAMMPAFAKLQSIEPFTIAPPGLPGDRDAPVIMDGPIYQVHAPGYWGHAHRDGQIELSGADGTPVANWVEETMEVMAPCWKPQRPGAGPGNGRGGPTS